MDRAESCWLSTNLAQGLFPNWLQRQLSPLPPRRPLGERISPAPNGAPGWQPWQWRGRTRAALPPRQLCAWRVSASASLTRGPCRPSRDPVKGARPAAENTGIVRTTQAKCATPQLRLVVYPKFRRCKGCTRRSKCPRQCCSPTSQARFPELCTTRCIRGPPSCTHCVLPWPSEPLVPWQINNKIA